MAAALFFIINTMIKTYKIYGLGGFIAVYKNKFLKFLKVYDMNPICVYRTDKKDEMEFLEEHEMFKNGTMVIDNVVEDAKPEYEVPELKDNNQVKSMQSAINILVQKYNVPEDELTDIESVISKSHEVGLRFVKLEEIAYAEGDTDRKD